MEPIEQELQDRKARLKKLAIELQRLEAAPRRPDDPRQLQKIVGLQYKLSLLKAGIRELEEIIAEGPSPPRRARPPKPRGRRLSPEERDRIILAARADFLAKLRAIDPGFDERNLQVTVGWTTDNNGKPYISISVRGA